MEYPKQIDLQSDKHFVYLILVCLIFVENVFIANLNYKSCENVILWRFIERLSSRLRLLTAFQLYLRNVPKSDAKTRVFNL